MDEASPAGAIQLRETARLLVREGRGILAADERTATLAKRFDAVGVPSTPETQHAYREMLFGADSIGESLSGVILFDETIHQSTASGAPFPEHLAAQAVLPGIKVDRGAQPLAGFPGETVTEGLDGLRQRLAEYRALGARFAKWRAVIAVDTELPTTACVLANAHALARYAALCQEAGLVPIVEPEVLMDGSHTLERCFAVTESMLRALFTSLVTQRVALEAMILKPNMVAPGKTCATQATTATIAAATVACLHHTVPAAVPGIAFLSGGQRPIQATERLDAINRLGPHPWHITFSFARALQEDALSTWRGQVSNVDAARQVFLHRAICNAAASRGAYSSDLEAICAVANLSIADRWPSWLRLAPIESVRSNNFWTAQSKSAPAYVAIHFANSGSGDEPLCSSRPTSR
ncbi:MAG: class I fructose-bisphosphate aldolase [Candidatus Dormibacter sp.]